jgi:HlyD family secretion protein
MKRIIWWILGGLLLLVVLAMVGKKAGWINSNKGTKVSVVKPEHHTIIETVAANGKIQPENEIKISSDISGEITALYVRDGDYVHKGQLLAKVNPQIYQSQMERLAASVDQSRAQLANAKASKAQADSRLIAEEATYKRNLSLHNQKVISDADFEASTSSYAVAKSQVEAAIQTIRAAEYAINSALASLKEANDNLSKTTITAPNDGTIYALKIERGERVVGTSQMAGTEMMRVADLNYMMVIVDVNENDIVRVHLGDTSTIEVDAYPNRKFKGVVYEIANAAKTAIAAGTDQATNFEVKIRLVPQSYEDIKVKLKANESPFRAGMNATVDIRTGIKENVLSIPIECVTTRDRNEGEKDKDKDKKPASTTTADKSMAERDAMEQVVFVVDSAGKARKVIVKTGIQDDKFIEILTPIAEDVQVITGPYAAISRTLKAGEKLQVVDKAKLYEK